MNADEKAQRILTEKRLLVKRVDLDSGLIIAECRGDSGAVYHLGYDPRDSQWRCTCQASADFHRLCSHLRSLQYVVVAKA